MPAKTASQISKPKKNSNGKPTASKGVVRHPEHRISGELEAALAAADEKRQAARLVQRAREAGARPTADERRKRAALIASALGVEPGVTKKLRDLDTVYRHRVDMRHMHPRDARILTNGSYFGGATQWDIGGPPLDHHFWWASTQWFASGGLQTEDLPDGLHFFGNRSYDGDDTLDFSIGAIALFELQADRRPASPTGRMNSEPSVELFGTIEGWTGVYNWPLAADDKWCKCYLSMRQTAWQFYLGQFADLGERIEERTILNEANESRSTSAALPGVVKMPAIQIAGALNLSVFVQLEVRFDIKLEGDSYIGFSPNIPVPNSAGSVLLRFQQWEPVPV
jgi:hypothetical protein